MALALTARQEVLMTVPEADRDRVSALATYLGNHEGGRPSDSARSAVRIYTQGGIAAIERWEARREAERNEIHRRERG